MVIMESLEILRCSLMVLKTEHLLSATLGLPKARSQLLKNEADFGVS
jgi:hypothetical protein